VLGLRGQEGTAAFLAAQGVRVVASLPAVAAPAVERQRGEGVWQGSLAGLRALRAAGYGAGGHALDLVYNPPGARLPPPAAALEAEYRAALLALGVSFDRILAITNMPIKRFADDLVASGEYEGYMGLLCASFNPATVPELMCRGTVSVAWDGTLWDCECVRLLGGGRWWVGSLLLRPAPRLLTPLYTTHTTLLFYYLARALLPLKPTLLPPARSALTRRWACRWALRQPRAPRPSRCGTLTASAARPLRASPSAPPRPATAALRQTAAAAAGRWQGAARAQRRCSLLTRACRAPALPRHWPLLPAAVGGREAARASEGYRGAPPLRTEPPPIPSSLLVPAQPLELRQPPGARFRHEADGGAALRLCRR
jgi:hypothetical protein